MRYLCCILLFFGIAVCGNGSSSICSSTAKQKTIKDSLHIGKTKVDVLLLLEEKPSISDQIWGDGGICPVMVIKRSTIVLNRKDPVWLPYAMFNDVVNPRTAHIRSNNGSIVLIINGGDASTAYELTIEIKDGCVVSRRIKSTEMNFGEETTYHYSCNESEQE